MFDKNGWPVGRCVACGFVYVLRVPPRSALDELYGKSFYTPGGPGYRDYMHEDWRLHLAQSRVAQIQQERAEAACLRSAPPRACCSRRHAGEDSRLSVWS